MSQTSFLEPHPPLADRLRPGRTGLWLSAVLGIAVVAVGASIFLTSAQEKTTTTAAPAAATDKSAHVTTPSQPPLALPGFQRRGPLLTGEVKTIDGSTLRLVIDTRNHAIIGYRLVEPAVSASQLAR
jgi:hypothetical protein